MANLRTRESRPDDDQASRAERADALIAKLESRIGREAKDRARLLGTIAASGLVEPHRDHNAYALGADQADCGLATGDARAMRGLMSIGPLALADLLVQAAKTSPYSHVTRLWTGLLDDGRSSFTARGAAVDAKRLANTQSAHVDQCTVFEKSVARAGVVEVHRDQVAFTLGADLFYCGLRADDALAMLGLMSIGPGRLAGELRGTRAWTDENYVARLWSGLLARHRDDYEARGRLVRWQRRWARYSVDVDAWLASPHRQEEGWRGKPMTQRQRHLVQDTATILDLPIPDGMNCGTAHDWLNASGANILYRREM